MAPYSPDALETGTTFADRYQIIEELGRGGVDALLLGGTPI
jgi:hypothetical protein